MAAMDRQTGGDIQNASGQPTDGQGTAPNAAGLPLSRPFTPPAESGQALLQQRRID